MDYRLGFWLFFSLLLLQSKVSSEDEVDGLARYIVDKVKAAIKELISMVKDAARKAVQDILDSKLAPAIEEIKKTAMKKLDESTETYKQSVSVYQHQANEQHVDIKSCISVGQEKRNEILRSSKVQLNTCLSDKMLEFGKIVREAVAAINSVKEAASNFQNASDKCRGGLSSVPCYTDLLVEMLKASAEFPVRITKEAIRVAKFLESLQTQVKACGENVTEQFSATTGALIGKVDKCIQSCMNIN